MPVTLRGDCALDVIEIGEGEFLNGNAIWFRNVEFRFGNGDFGLGDFCEEFGVGGFGFGGAVDAEVDGFTAVVDDGVVFLFDFYFTILGQLVFEFGHDLFLSVG